MQLQNLDMSDEKTKEVPRAAGRPREMQGQQVQVTLRMTRAQREKLDVLGGAAWVRAQIERAKPQP